MATVTVIEQQLAAARADERRAARDDAQRKIEELRREGASLRQQLEPLAKQVRDAQNERLRLHKQLLAARGQIESHEQPLDPLALPSDEELAEHDRQLGLWKLEHETLLAKHRAAVERESVRPKAIAIHRRLDSLQREIANWTAVAEGRLPGAPPEGGVFRAGEDFLGHSDRRFD